MENTFQTLITRRNIKIAIFSLLLLISVGSLIYVHSAYGHPLRQSIVANVATDALFSIVTIYAIGSIENLRRKRENQRANEQVYRDLEIVLNKIMLKLLIELGHADKKAAVRTNAMYLDDNQQIYGAFWHLTEDDERLNQFVLNFAERNLKNINNMVRISKTIREGLGQIAHLSKMIRPAPMHTNINGEHRYWKIEDLTDYKKYLTDGKKYETHILTNDNGSLGVETKVYTTEWGLILAQFKRELKGDMEYIADIYDLCHDKEL